MAEATEPETKLEVEPKLTRKSRRTMETLTIGDSDDMCIEDRLAALPVCNDPIESCEDPADEQQCTVEEDAAHLTKVEESAQQDLPCETVESVTHYETTNADVCGQELDDNVCVVAKDDTEETVIETEGITSIPCCTAQNDNSTDVVRTDSTSLMTKEEVSSISAIVENDGSEIVVEIAETCQSIEQSDARNAEVEVSSSVDALPQVCSAVMVVGNDGVETLTREEASSGQHCSGESNPQASLSEQVEGMTTHSQSVESFAADNTCLRPSETNVSSQRDVCSCSQPKNLHATAPALQDTRVTEAVVPLPLSAEQLDMLYYNPQLERNEEFITAFLQEIQPEKHEFYELLLNYYRARNHLASAEHDVAVLQKSYEQQQKMVWTSEMQTLTVQGLCQDKTKVNAHHTYEKAMYDEASAKLVASTLKDIRNQLHDQLALYAYEARLSRLQLEHHMHTVYKQCASFSTLPQNAPVKVMLPHEVSSSLRHQVARLRLCITTLFLFHRKPTKDVVFVENVKQWIVKMVSFLLRIASVDDHLYVLNHLLRCPPGVGSWAGSLLQLPSSGDIMAHRSDDGRNPLLDHFVTVVATLMRPIKERESLLYQLKVTSCVQDTDKEAAWIVVDSDGEEVALEEISWMYLHEGDMMAMLNQLPLDTIFRYLLMVQPLQGEEEVYCGVDMSCNAVLRLFAFAYRLVSILGEGLQNFSLSCYRQLNKRLARTIRDIVYYISDHWLHIQMHNDSTSQRMSSEMARLQVQFDELFKKAVICILSASRPGSWQFLADMPYASLTSDMMWRLAGIMQQGCHGAAAIDETLTADAGRQLMTASSNKHCFEETLICMPISELTYLLTTFANMACSRPPTEQQFADAIAMQIFEIAYISQHTRELCSKPARDLLQLIALDHPQTMSSLLRATIETIDKLGTVALYLFQGLPLSYWKPAECDLIRLRECLLECAPSSIHHQMAAFVIQHLNWQIDKQSSALFLNHAVHRWMAVLAVEVHTLHLAGKNVNSLAPDVFRQISLSKERAVTDQSISDWTWQCMLRLRLHADTRPHVPPGGEPENEPLDLAADKPLWAVQVAMQNGCPLAVYAALLMTTYGHGPSDVCCDGLKLLSELVEKGHYVATIVALSALVPQFYDVSHYLTENQIYMGILHKLLQADVSKKGIFFGEFPGPVVEMLSEMIQHQITEAKDATPVIIFWLKCFTAAPKWHLERSILYVINNLLRASFRISGIEKTVQELFDNIYQNQMCVSRSAGMLSSLVSWLSPGASTPSFIVASACAEFPWYACVVLAADTRQEGTLWKALLTELRENPSSSIDQALMTACGHLKLSSNAVASRLCIYRWANQAIEMEVAHPLLPLVWQAFFLLYLGRQPQHDEAGLPERGSLGERFFESTSYNSMMKKMKRKLKEASDHYHVQVMTNERTSVQREADEAFSSEQKAHEHSDSQKDDVYKTLVTFYQSLLFWLDEPRLHDGQLYLPALPPQYDPERLLTLFQVDAKPWIELVDIQRVDAKLNKMSTNWAKCISAPDTEGHNLAQKDNQSPFSAAQRILQRLRSHPMPASPPLVTQSDTPIAEVSTSLLCDKHSLLFALRADFNSLVDYAKLYSMRVAKHVGLDCNYMELLPQLYSNKPMEAVLTTSCKSKFNLAHKCKGAAVITVRYNARARNDIKQREADENRAEYKQLMIEAMLPPAQNICSAVMHVEHVITRLLNLLTTSGNDVTRSTVSEVGIALFYQITTFICEETKFYAPTRQFFSSCIEILGQELIRGDASQSQPLLQAILQSPQLVSLLLPNFNPNASVQLFVTIYDDLCRHIGGSLNSAVIFSLLSKFDVNKWLQTSSPSLSQRSALLQAISGALCLCGKTPEKPMQLVFEIYRSHLQQTLSYHFPDLYGETLKSLVKGSADGQLSPRIWQDFLECLGCDCSKIGPRSESAVQLLHEQALEQTREPTKRMAVLSYSQLTDTIKWMANYFLQCRLADQKAFGLYPQWHPYVTSLATFLQDILRMAIATVTADARLGHRLETEALVELWQQTTDVFLPWIQTLEDGDKVLSPWIPNDAEVATVMVVSWVASVSSLQDLFQGLLVPFSPNALCLLWSYYATTLAKENVPEHVVATISHQMAALPWLQFSPDLQLLQQMIAVQSRGAVSSSLVTTVYTCVDWPNIIRLHCCTHQVAPQFAADLLTAFLTLTTRIASKTETSQEEDLIRVIRLAESFPWHFVDAEYYDHITRWVPEHFDPRCVLLSSTSQTAHCLKLLKVAGQFGHASSAPSSPSSPPSSPSSLRLSSPSHEANKWHSYVRCVAQLLGGCAKRSDVPANVYDAVVTGTMTEIEATLETVSVPIDQSRVAELLCAELLLVLNGCSARGGDGVATVITRAIHQWLAHNAGSVLLRACLASSCRVLASHVHMLQMTEMCIDVHFTTASDWPLVLSSLQVPELSRDSFLRIALQRGAYHTLYAHTLQQLALSQSIDGERDILVRLLSWNRQVQPTADNASKLIVWWYEMLGLLLRQSAFGANATIIGRDLTTFIAGLAPLAEDKTSSGLLGAIGLGRRSQLPVRLRLIAKALSAFSSLQLTSGGCLRLPPGDTTSPPPSPSSPSPAVSHLESLRQNRHYTAYREHIDYAFSFMHDRLHTFADARPFLRALTIRLFPDERFLEIVRSSPE